MSQSDTSSTVGLHRAIVAEPQLGWSGPYTERVVFFESPGGVHASSYLAQVLALIWGRDTSTWCEDGSIYNVASKDDLAQQSWNGEADSHDLYLFETGCGGENGIGPNRIHYARVADVDCFVSPKSAKRLHRALSIIEALHGDQDAIELLSKIRGA